MGSPHEYVLLPELCLVNGRCRSDIAVHVRGGLVAGCGPRMTVRMSARGAAEHELPGVLLPGLIDLQVNGAGGHNCDATDRDALDAVAAAVRVGGGQWFLPTLITAPLERLLDRCGRLADWIERGPKNDAAVPLGIHLEGPFLEAPGTHEQELFVDPTPDRIEALLEACRGHLRLVTLAPGRAGAAEAVAKLHEAGVAVSLGHGQDSAQFGACVDAGAGAVTHLYNAMSGLHHRDPGLVGLALNDPRVMCSLILDGHHVGPVAAQLAWRLLGPERFVLVSDSISAAGMPDGDYRLGDIEVTAKDGVVRNSAGELAGSALTMAGAALGLLQQIPGTGAVEVAQCAAINPAKLLGIESTHGEIAPGRVARFAFLDKHGGLSSVGPGLAV